MECNSMSYAPFFFAIFSAYTCFISIFSLYYKSHNMYAIKLHINSMSIQTFLRNFDVE